jgi:hypothetical protein
MKPTFAFTTLSNKPSWLEILVTSLHASVCALLPPFSNNFQKPFKLLLMSVQFEMSAYNRISEIGKTYFS